MQRPSQIITLILGLVAGPAAAQDAAVPAPSANPARLEYVAPDPGSRCPSRESFEDIVAARLGYPAFSNSGVRLIVARIELVDNELHAQVEVRNQAGVVEGTRDFNGGAGECTDVVQAMAVAIAVTIDPSSLAGPVPVVSSSGTRPPPPPILVTTTTPEPPAWRPEFYVDASLNFLSAPGVGLGPRLGIALSRSSFSIALEGEVSRQLAHATTDLGDRIAAHVYTGALVPCLLNSVVEACAVARFGAFSGNAENLDNAQNVTRFWSSAGARVGLRISLTDFISIRMNTDFAAAVSRTNLTIDGQTVWSAPVFTVGVGIGALLHFF